MSALAEPNLKTQLHAYGTNIEGEWDAVFNASKRCHEVVHEMGAPRISTTLGRPTGPDNPTALDGNALAQIDDRAKGRLTARLHYIGVDFGGFACVISKVLPTGTQTLFHMPP